MTPERRSNLEAELLQVREELTRTGVARRRYFTEDATPERLLELEAESGNGIAVIRDELSGIMEVWRKKGREGERQMYLEGWNGDGPYSSDRKTASSTYVEKHCISLLGGIQPGRVAEYLQGALDHAQQDDGFFQRLQLLVWPEIPRTWEAVDREPDAEAQNRAYEVFRRLDELTATDLNLDTIEAETPALRFTPDAQEYFDAWRDELEHRLRSGELLHSASFESHLAKYRSLMPSLALLFHLINIADGEAPGPVTLEAATLAAGWCEYLELHARKLYAPEIRSDVMAARALAEKIQEGVVQDGDTVREIYRRKWEGLDQAGVEKAIQILTETNWVRTERVVGAKGGRPSNVLRIHPVMR